MVLARLWWMWLPIAAAAALFLYLRVRSPAPFRYATAPVSRGSVVRSVVATGTVNPVITVQVGSYVSGPITAIYADFNSPVKAGQLIAKIDPRPFEVKVDQATAAVALAKAQLGKDQADLNYKKLTFERDLRLRAEDTISQDALDNARSAYAQANAQVALDRANIQQQQANLQEAKVNLNYSNIVSPVDGTVVSRNVDVGQTVAASFQTPTLFLIARDLTQMQVDTNVSESDVGNVRTEQSANFTVDAFPGRKFDGMVAQVRQAPVTVQNVVTYDVVVNVANREFLLKPGMTAYVTIITAERDNVLRVPAQALRFSPRRGTETRLNHAPGGPPHQERVWLEDHGTLKPVPVVTGLADSNYVEVLRGDLKPGDMVVTQQLRVDASAGAGPQSPLRFPR
jgi:HlyD family secretion protein